MAFTFKSNTAKGLPTKKKQLLSDELDLGMKCFLRQTPYTQATLALRHSLSHQNSTNYNNHSVITLEGFQNRLKKDTMRFKTSEQATSGCLGNLRQPTAEAYPIELPKHSVIGSNDYRKFVGQLGCDTKKRACFLKSLSRENERRRLKILNDCQSHPRSTTKMIMKKNDLTA